MQRTLRFLVVLVGVAVGLGLSLGGSRALTKTQEQKALKPAESAQCTPSPTNSAYGFKVKDIEGNETDLKTFQGKVGLFVNTASKCGYTGQYKDLQALYEKFKDKGFVVLGFPSNDFRSQEPGTNKEIKTFCELNYKVSFPLFEKASVKGPAIQPLYKFLTGDPKFNGEVGWNFEKFLVDRSGRIVGRFKTRTPPMDESIVAKIEEALAAKDSMSCQ